MGLAHRVVSRMPTSVRRLLVRMPGARSLRDRLYRHPNGSMPDPGTPRPVVYLPTWTEWDVMPQRPQYLLEAFADAGHPIWFVDPRLDHDCVVEPNIRLVPDLTAVPPTDVILFVHFAPLLSLIELFQNAAVVYDVLDDLTIYDPDEKHLPSESKVRSHHDALVAAADVVTVSNPVLGKRHGGGRTDVILVENGVDLDRFTPNGPVVEGFGHGPIVGYHGAIAEWFDFDLMAAVAETSPDLKFVLVGPVYDRVAKELEQLLTIPNIAHFPPQPGGQIAEFVRRFDVGIIPFLVYEMTEGVTPLKMYEYMACRVPVVSTPLPACVEHPGVATADNSAVFGEQVREALGLESERRHHLATYAIEASWSRRLRPVVERLDRLGIRLV